MEIQNEINLIGLNCHLKDILLLIWGLCVRPYRIYTIDCGDFQSLRIAQQQQKW